MRYIILSLLFALCFIGNLQAATNYYVNDANGNDSWDGLAPIWDGVHGPKRTIQLAIDVTLAGDTVIVAEGTYSDWGYLIDFGGKAIAVRSNDPNDPAVVKATIIKAPGGYPGFWFHSGEDSDSVVAGFTIIGDLHTYTDYGGGIFCENASSPTIRNCVIKECRADYGGGGIACLGNSSPLVTNCKIVDSRCLSGSAIYCGANSNPEIINCLIDNNHGNGMIYCKNSSPVITNCTIAANPYRDGVYCYSNSGICSPIIRNCIFANNTDNAITESGALADPNVAYCLFYNNANGDWYDHDTSTTLTGAPAINALPEARDNLDDAPLLTPNGHLQATSPCIDAGDSSVNAGQLDIDYEPRVVNGLVEIGADEFFDTDGDGLPDWWERHFYNSDIAADPGGDDDGDGKTNIVEYGLGTNPLGPYYVDVNGNDLWNGFAAVWDGTNGPKATIQAAINVAESDDTIIVALGRYTYDGNRDIDFYGKAITVRSTDPNNSNVVNNTIIDCTGGGRGFYFHNNEGPNSVAAGLTITNGSAQGYNDAKGGAILCESSSPTITRCIITDNHVTVSSTGYAEGGAIYCENNSSPTISYCTIVDNTAIGMDSTGMEYPSNAQGGAISCHGGSPTISNCVISNNRAMGGNAGQASDGYSVRPGGVGYGGGLYFDYSGPTVIDCTINNNEATGGNGGDAPDYGSSEVHGGEGGSGLGGGIYLGTDCSPIIVDCTVRKNTIRGGNGGRGGRGDMGNLPGNGGKGGDALGVGVYLRDSTTVINRCKLIDNSGQAGDGGHGGDVEWPEPEPTPPPAGDGGAGGKGGGGGLYCEEKSQPADPNITITNCVINYNKVSGGLGGSGGYSMQGSSNGMDGADGQTSGAGFYSDSYSEVILSNSTFNGNSTERSNGQGGGFYCDGSLPNYFYVTNCIFKSSPDHAIYDNYSGADVTVEYSLFWGNPDGDYFDADTWATYPGDILGPGNIISSPLLIVDGYHLRLGSPCINSGSPGGGSSQYDVDKELRLLGGNIDIGCDEWLDSDGDGLPDWWEWKFFDSNTAAVAGDDIDGDDSNNINEYYAGTNPLGPYYVDVNGSDEWDGISASWDGTHGPKATIQAAIDIATDNDEVVVAVGTYTGLGNRDLDFYGKAIILHGTDPCDPNVVANTIIDCQGSSSNRHRGFYFHSGEDTNSVVSGFSIINGYSGSGAGIQCEDSDPLISRCIIRDMGDGSGIYCVNSSAEIRDCTISNCADYGIRGLSGSISRCVISGNGSGGIYTSAAQINSCLITGNSSSNYGGGIYCTGNVTAITNCTITNNAAGLKGGGIYCYYSSPKITNCIFANNTNHAIYEYQSADPFVSYCLFHNNLDGDYYDRDTSSTLTGADAINSLAEAANNIDGDPFFAADGYHLKSFSSCINTGDPNNASYSGQTDIDSESRIRYGRIDIGAGEVFPIGGDFEPDEDVDMLDFGTFSIEWLNSCSQPDWCDSCDIDQNTTVDFADFARFALHWLYGVEN